MSVIYMDVLFKFVFFVEIGQLIFNVFWTSFWTLLISLNFVWIFYIFDFFSETAEWILTKLDRKQVLNVLYQVCVFRADLSSKMAALASDWLKYFWTSSLQPLNGFWRNFTGSKSSTSSTKFVFFVPICHPRWPPWPLIGWNIFGPLLRNRWTDFNETWQEASP